MHVTLSWLLVGDLLCIVFSFAMRVKRCAFYHGYDAAYATGACFRKPKRNLAHWGLGCQGRKSTSLSIFYLGVLRHADWVQSGAYYEETQNSS
jgi:hypothetical protein